VGFAAFACAMLLAFQLFEYKKDNLTLVLASPLPLRAVVYAAGLVLFLLTGDYGGDTFIYFQF
jgi:hypothetical protein